MSDQKEVNQYPFPVSPIRYFTGQMTGNVTMDSLKIMKLPLSVIGGLDPCEELPEPVQRVIEDIRSASGIEEKAAIAHSFSQSYIHDTLQARPGFMSERSVSFEELAKSPYGDCDDHMRFTAGLLLRGGVAPEDVLMLGGMVRYPENPRAYHAFVAVRDEDRFLLLDNNIEGVPYIDPKNPVVGAYLVDDQGSRLRISGNVPAETQVKIETLYMAIDGRGRTYLDTAKLYKDSQVFREAMERALGSSPDTSASSKMPPVQGGPVIQGQGSFVPAGAPAQVPHSVQGGAVIQGDSSPFVGSQSPSDPQPVNTPRTQATESSPVFRSFPAP